MQDKYNYNIANQRQKDMRNQIKKHELETKNCTFKPEILAKSREPTPDNVDEKRKKTTQSKSPDLIHVPVGNKIEDRLLERG